MFAHAQLIQRSLIIPNISGGNESLQLPGGSDDLDALILQNIVQHNQDYICQFCYKSSKMKQTIKRHIESHHVDSGGRDCYVCGFHSKTRHAMYEHMRNYHPQDKKVNRI